MRMFTGYDPRNGRREINECDLTLADEVQHAPTDLLFVSQTYDYTEDPLPANSNFAGDRGRRRQYGPDERPGLQSTPTTLPGQTAERAIDVPVPKDVTSLCIPLSVESRQQKLFVSHLINMTGE